MSETLGSQIAALDNGPIPWQRAVMVRLADEGIPINAIARSLRTPSSDVREIIKEACEKSQILAVPRDDWPPGSQRDGRLPDCVRLSMADPVFITHLMRAYHVTGSEAALLAGLIRRPEMTRASLHVLIQREGRDEDTDIKIVDVFMCKLRAKLKKHGIFIKTIWGRGYFLEPAGRKMIMEKLGIPAEDGPEAGAVADVLSTTSGGAERQVSKAA